jgi:hypothetical protein
MSSVLTEFEPDVVRDIRIGNGSETRLVAGVDYSVANAIFASKSVDGRRFDLVDNVPANMDELEYFDLVGGRARLSTRSIERTDRCFLYAAKAVSNSAEWAWAKVKVQDGPFDGYACLAIKHDTAEAVLVSLRGMS